MAQLLVNDYNVGTDLQQVIIVPAQGPNLSANAIGHLEEINASQDVTENTIKPVLYQGIPLHRNIYHGWMGELRFTRFNGDVTNLMARIAERFHSTGEESYFTIYMTVRNTAAQAAGQANAIEEYAFLRAVFSNHKIGPFSGTAQVEAPLSFRCQDLILPGGSANVLANGPTAA